MPEPQPASSTEPTSQPDAFSDFEDVLPSFAADARERTRAIDGLRSTPEVAPFIPDCERRLRRDVSIYRDVAAEIQQLIGHA